MIMIWRAVGFHWHCDGIVFHYDGFLPGHEGDILCMDHNEQLLATGSADKTVKLWSGVSKIHRGNGFTTVSADVLTTLLLGTYATVSESNLFKFWQADSDCGPGRVCS